MNIKENKVKKELVENWHPNLHMRTPNQQSTSVQNQLRNLKQLSSSLSGSNDTDSNKNKYHGKKKIKFPVIKNSPSAGSISSLSFQNVVTAIKITNNCNANLKKSN